MANMVYSSTTGMIVMLALFSDLFQELEERIEQFEKYGDIKPGYQYEPKYVINNRLTTLGKKELKPNGLD
ncbi:hypothetical protein [Lactiplantibacillus plantarum]|uniref:hypothetical protein n=1 Tax=Lactiplantibacillus plantarum TaxID=1590 RepID=UPI0021CB99BD|nr:hypothetical protein [Lactiplantibacillus plantarum]